MDEIQNIKVEGLLYSFIQMDKWTEKSKWLMAYCQKHGATLQKYYWRSKFDINHIEYFEPKIVDAFTMCIDIWGDYHTILCVLSKYKRVAKMLETITYIGSMDEEEIKNIAYKALSSTQLQ